jgi:cardiolipin synthase
MRGMFVIAAVTDSLDGLIARRWNMHSKIGAILDPAADKTLMVCGVLYYTFAANIPVIRLPSWLTFTVFIRDFLIVFFAYLMYTRMQLTRFPPSVYGKMSTILQMSVLSLTIAVNAFAPWIPPPFVQRLLPLVALLYRASMLMTLISGWHYLNRGRQILRELSPAAA